jgi:predicted nucleic acid-binding protein
VKIVVDTNIIFSGLLNTNSTIADILINSSSHFEFYSCNYMRKEIQRHRLKLKNRSGLNENQLADAEFTLFSRLKFVNEELIPKVVWEEALSFTEDVDI